MQRSFHRASFAILSSGFILIFASKYGKTIVEEGVLGRARGFSNPTFYFLSTYLLFIGMKGWRIRRHVYTLLQVTNHTSPFRIFLYSTVYQSIIIIMIIYSFFTSARSLTPVVIKVDENNHKSTHKTTNTTTCSL